MIALVIVAGSAFAADGDSRHPYLNSKQTYRVTGMSVSETGTVSVAYSNPDAVTISKPRTGALASSNTNLANTSTDTYTFVTGTTEIYFDVTYNSVTDGDITVTLTDGSVGSCQNSIKLPIDVLDIPSLVIGLGDDLAAECMTLGIPSHDADAASVGKTTVTFTTTPVASGGATDYTYNYVLTLSGHDILTGVGDAPSVTSGTATLSVSGNVITVTNAAAGAVNAPVTITVKIKSVEGTPATLVGTLSNPTMLLSAAQGGLSIIGTVDADGPRNVPFNAMPTIGTFSF